MSPTQQIYILVVVKRGRFIIVQGRVDLEALCLCRPSKRDARHC